MALPLNIGVVELAAHYLHIVQAHHPAARHRVLRLLRFGRILLEMINDTGEIEPVAVVQHLHIESRKGKMAHIHRLAQHPQQAHPHIKGVKSRKGALAVVFIHRQPLHLHMAGEQIHPHTVNIHLPAKQIFAVIVHIIACSAPAEQRPAQKHQDKQRRQRRQYNPDNSQ